MPRDIIEWQHEPFGKSFGGSIMLHVGIVAALALLMFVNDRVRGSEWGNNAPPGAVQATLARSRRVCQIRSPRLAVIRPIVRVRRL